MEQSEDLTCAELVELVTEYLENALPLHERRRFEEHLTDCPGCSIYLEQMQTTITAAGRFREEPLDPRVTDELLAAFRGWNSPGVIRPSG
jgi:anti-sigma factor RsiW